MYMYMYMYIFKYIRKHEKITTNPQMIKRFVAPAT